MKTIVTVALRQGLIAGLLGFVFLLGLFFMGRHPMLISPVFDFRIILFGVFFFFTLREIRDAHRGGILYFWEAMIACFMITVSYAMLSGLGFYAFGTLNDNFVPEYIRVMTEHLKGISPEDIQRIGKDSFERNLSALPSTNAGDLAVLYFWQCFPIGLFISIILSVIVRRQPKT